MSSPAARRERPDKGAVVGEPKPVGHQSFVFPWFFGLFLFQREQQGHGNARLKSFCFISSAGLGLLFLRLQEGIDHGNLLAEDLLPDLGVIFLAAAGDFADQLRTICRHHRHIGRNTAFVRPGKAGPNRARNQAQLALMPHKHQY